MLISRSSAVAPRRRAPAPRRFEEEVQKCWLRSGDGGAEERAGFLAGSARGGVAGRVF